MAIHLPSRLNISLFEFYGTRRGGFAANNNLLDIFEVAADFPCIEFYLQYDLPGWTNSRGPILQQPSEIFFQLLCCK